MYGREAGAKQFSHPFFIYWTYFQLKYVYVVKHIATVRRDKVTPIIKSRVHATRTSNGFDFTLAKNHPATNAS